MRAISCAARTPIMPKVMVINPPYSSQAPPKPADPSAASPNHSSQSLRIT